MTASSKEDSPDCTPSATALRSMHTGQNSIAPENSLPQLGQVRWDSIFMDLTALQSESGPKTTPRSTPVVGNQPTGPLANCSPVPQANACFLRLARQITLRNKIPIIDVLRLVGLLDPSTRNVDRTSAGQRRSEGGDPILSATGDRVTLRSQIFGQILFHLSRCLERHRI